MPAAANAEGAAHPAMTRMLSFIPARVVDSEVLLVVRLIFGSGITSYIYNDDFCKHDSFVTSRTDELEIWHCRKCAPR